MLLLFSQCTDKLILWRLGHLLSSPEHSAIWQENPCSVQKKKKKRLDKLCYCTITRSWRKRIIKVEHNVNCNQYKDRLRWHWIAEGQHFFCIWRVVGKPVKGFRSLGKLCVFSWTLSYSQCPFHKEEERKLRVFKSHPLFKSTQSRVFVKLTGPYC